jgi:hypothetical protein
VVGVNFLSLICDGRIHKFSGTILREKFAAPYLSFLTQGKKAAIKAPIQPLDLVHTDFLRL